METRRLSNHTCDRKGAPAKVVDESYDPPITAIYPTCSVCGKPQVLTALPGDADVEEFKRLLDHQIRGTPVHKFWDQLTLEDVTIAEESLRGLVGMYRSEGYAEKAAELERAVDNLLESTPRSPSKD